MRRLFAVAVALAALLVVGGAGVAGACKLTSIDCHLSGTPEDPDLSEVSGAITVPKGFSAERVAADLRLPTAFDFLPDGRILIAEKDGLVKIVADGKVDPTPVLDLRGRINTAFYRGLMALAVDPEFMANHFIYVVYTPKLRGTAATSKLPTHVVVSRFVLRGARAGSERIIVGAAADASGACGGLPSTADCLPAEVDHIGADLAFAPDGSLFISTGEGGGLEEVEEAAFAAQDVDALGGKVLRVTRDGAGLPSNPFFDGDPSSNRSKVWAIGLRNPFRMTLMPGSTIPVVGDVGWRHVDEIDVVRRGDNLGWPCYEGTEQTMDYRSTERCRAFYAAGTRVVPPAIVVPHGPFSSVTGGVFVGDGFPADYRGYYYGDWAQNWIKYARVGEGADPLGSPLSFAEEAGGPVALRVGPDGSLYVLCLNYDALLRISPSGA